MEQITNEKKLIVLNKALKKHNIPNNIIKLIITDFSAELNK